MILHVFNTHTPIYLTLYIPLKALPGKGVEGPFLISLRLKTGPAAVCSVNNHIIGLIPAVFNLIEVKTGIKC